MTGFVINALYRHRSDIFIGITSLYELRISVHITNCAFSSLHLNENTCSHYQLIFTPNELNISIKGWKKPCTIHKLSNVYFYSAYDEIVHKDYIHVAIKANHLLYIWTFSLVLILNVFHFNNKNGHEMYDFFF